MKPQEAFDQLNAAQALDALTLEELKTMAPKKKTPMKTLRHMFATKPTPKKFNQLDHGDN